MTIRAYKVTLDQLKAKVEAGYLTAKQCELTLIRSFLI